MPDLPVWATPLLVAAVFLVMLLVETSRPLRRSVESKLRRVSRNLTVAGIAFGSLTLLQTPFLLPVSRWAMKNGVGLLQLVPLPEAVQTAVAVVLLDYTLWHWHWLNHKVPFLWRFHLVHHLDLDMDASTGLRFHFGELTLSIVYRMLQIVAIGATPLSVWIWQMLVFVSILFHHSNTRLPLPLERVLVKLVVTPRMHGIHHSDYRNETNSNWSSVLSAWDYLHGTVLLDIPQQEVVIGVPAYRAREDVTLPKVLTLPFRGQREDWARPDGALPDRPHDLSAKARLQA